MDAELKRTLEAKVYAGERLTREDGIALLESDDLAWLGRLAHHQRTEINGDRTLFAVNRSVNLVDVGTAGEWAGEGLTEVRLVAEPGRAWSDYPAAVREIKAALPGVGVTGFSAADIAALETSSDQILDELVNAGLESLAGDEGDWDTWSRVHRRAHAQGLKTPASMVYAHGDEPERRVDHLLRLRDLQGETGGFVTFVPVRHRPASADDPITAPAESLKFFAVSRLLLDNVPHLQGSTATHEVSVVQLALNFGADEIDGSAAPMGRDDLLTLIWDAGFRPLERDSRYAAVREYDAAPSFTDRRSEPQQVWA